MNDKKHRIFNDYVAYNLRRAAQERRKARETWSVRDRLGRLEIAGIFEARAQAAGDLTLALLTRAGAPHESSPTLH
jgi:hypothetical protein